MDSSVGRNAGIHVVGTISVALVWADDDWDVGSRGDLLHGSTNDQPKLWWCQQWPALGVLAVSFVAGLHFADGRCSGAIKDRALFLSGVVGGKRPFGFLVEPEPVGPSMALSDLAKWIATVKDVVHGAILSRWRSFSQFAVGQVSKSGCR